MDFHPSPIQLSPRKEKKKKIKSSSIAVLDNYLEVLIELPVFEKEAKGEASL